MIEVRHSEDRGLSCLEWLDSRHTFSFGDYYDPEHMGISALRVINDDKVIPGAGFATHSHRDMEIITYVKQGAIEHKDSLGHVEVLPAGEFQLMSAGTGVTHSEYNPSATKPLEFLQIWIQPNQLDIQPGYQQKKFARKSGLQLIASPDARQESLLLHQDASLYQLIVQAGHDVSHNVDARRTLYVHVVSGHVSVNGESLHEGDGATVRDVAIVAFMGVTDSEALVFDLP